jgi:hypothetical protein
VQIELRVFTESGSASFQRLMTTSPRPENLLSLVKELVEDPGMSFSLNVQVELRSVYTRFELGQHLHECFKSNPELRSQAGNKHFWNWFSAAYMPILLGADNRRLEKKLGKQFERWVLTENTLRYHRHLVSSPYFIYQANADHIERAMVLLASPILAPGEAVEKISGTRNMASGSILFLATLLWFDWNTRELRPLRTSSKYAKIRDLNAYISQIDVNVDFEVMDISLLLNMLPSHFGHWVELARTDLPNYV